VRDITRFIVPPDATIREAISAIDRSEFGIALVVDQERRLLDTITDGDIRRAMLAGVNFESPVSTLAERRRRSPYPRPVTAPANAERADLLAAMEALKLRHVPLVDGEGFVVDLVVLEDLVPHQMPGLQAMVMAGGLGTRLRPLTADTPKPLLPVRGRPLLEITLARLQQAGIRRVNVATCFLPEKIESHLGDGRRFGVELKYVREPSPLGTAGALSLLEPPKERLLVLNGDILTDLDFRAMVDFHVEHAADLTMAVRRIDLEVPYGVVACDGVEVQRLTEKPSMSVMVNAGIYLLEPVVFNHLTPGAHLNMTDLIADVLTAGRRVVSFPIREYWLDIGRPADYDRAQHHDGIGIGAIERQP
jgi:dTDP-glucose pyrophosphorylase/CBS domain-containing protein